MADSQHTFIARSRAERVVIEYDVELYGATKKYQLPFVVGVLADLSGCSTQALPAVAERKLHDIDSDNFASRMMAIAPRVAFSVPDTLLGSGDLSVDITFGSLDDFAPAAVARKVGALAERMGVRQQLMTLMSYVDGNDRAEELLARLLRQTLPAAEWSAEIEQVFRPRTEAARQALQEALQTLLRESLAHSETVSTDALAIVQGLVAALDRALGRQLDAILHHEDFRTLEGAWRGLHYLVSNTETDETLKIRFMNISKAEVGKTLRRYQGMDWDQSPLFKRIYEDAYGEFGGEPLGCLVADYFFDHTVSDVEWLGAIARICAAAHTPCLAGASMNLLDLGTLLQQRTSVSHALAMPEYAAWRGLRESDESRYVSLALPRFLARAPYGTATSTVEEFDFVEDAGDGDPGKYAWCNAAYAMAVNVTRAFKLYGWCARIRGAESGGAVEGLPTHRFPTDDGTWDMRCPVELAINDRREAELAASGLMALLHRKGSDFAVFFSASSLNKPFEYDDPDATTNARLAATLPYLFACSRFAQYLKCLVRDQIGSYKTPSDMERSLQQWIDAYCDPEFARQTETTRARKPLASAEVHVEEVEGNPGYYAARFFLRPCYQLEDLTTSLRIVSTLPAAKAAA